MIRIPLWKRQRKKGSSFWSFILPKRFKLYVKINPDPIRIRVGPITVEFQYDRNIDLGRIQLRKVSHDTYYVLIDTSRPINTNTDLLIIPIVIANAKEVGIEGTDYITPIGLIAAIFIFTCRIIGKWMK